jgi:argininosuccinate lyase
MKTALTTATLLLYTYALPVAAQTLSGRDEFYWIGQINKASAAINSEEGLLDKA